MTHNRQDRTRSVGRATQHIALLDLDGTLIYPGGYRAAYSAALGYLLRAMNLSVPLPGSEVQEMFESLSVNSEWDMLPITIAVILEAAYQTIPQISVPATLAQAIDQLRSVQLGTVRVEYVDRIREMGPYFQGAVTPSLGVLAAATQSREGLAFPRLGSTPLLEDLLGDTRDVRRSMAVRLFETYALGTRLFSSTYGVPAQFSCESYLKLYDEVLISDQTRIDMLERSADGRLHVCILTSRPSEPPKGIPARRHAVPTEAGMALQLLGMPEMPLIGYGSLRYLADQHGIAPDQLLKPSPIQALAAIGAAWTGEEWTSLKWAYQMYCGSWERGERGGSLAVSNQLTPALPQSFHLHVFEDSPTGVISGRKAARILEARGVAVEFDAWGISQVGIKRAALEAYGAHVYGSIDEALQDFRRAVAQ